MIYIYKYIKETRKQFSVKVESVFSAIDGNYDEDLLSAA